MRLRRNWMIDHSIPSLPGLYQQILEMPKLQLSTFICFGIMHVAMLHVNNVYGTSFSNMFAVEAEALNINVFSMSYKLVDDNSV